jgi:hypothetical protein
MNGAQPDWLAQLAPPHAPPPPGWWPPAPGWWILAILLIAALAALIYWWTRPNMRLRRAALREFKRLQASAADDADLARGLEHLVRRYAISRFGREPVAVLSGERWLAFVIAHGGAAWAGDAGSSLLRAAYGGTAQADRARWLAGARAFLEWRS